MGLFEGELGELYSSDIDFSREESFNIIHTSATSQVHGIVTRKQVCESARHRYLFWETKTCLNSKNQHLGIWGYKLSQVEKKHAELGAQLYIVDCVGDYKCVE